MKFLPLKLLLAVLFVLGQTRVGHAQSGRGGQPGALLRFGVGAKALGMANTFTSQADDASAVYWNPAGLGQINQMQLAVMQSQLFLDTRYQFFALAGPLRFLDSPSLKHAFGVGLVSLGIDDFERTNLFNAPDGTFSSSEYALMLSYSLNWVRSWGSVSVGAKPLLFSQSVAGVSGSGYGADVGLVFQPLSPRFLGWIPLEYLMPLRIGVNYRMLSSLTLRQTAQDYPNSLNFGVSYAAFEDVLNLGLSRIGLAIDHLPFKMLVSYEYQKLFGTARPGGHYFGTDLRVRLWRAMVASVRLGYKKSANQFENRFTWGVGLKTDVDFLANTPFIKGLDVDVSRLGHPELGAAYQLYFTLRLGDWYNNVRRAPRSAPQMDALMSEVETAQKRRAENGVAASDTAALVVDLNRQRAQLRRYEAEFLRFLTEFPRDDRVVAEGDSLDLLYKETVAARLSRLASLEPDSFLVNRYDEFVGRLYKTQKESERFLTGISCGYDRGEAARIRRTFEKYQRDLSKPIYTGALQSYLKLLLLAGDRETVRQIARGEHASIKNERFLQDANTATRFLALATNRVEHLDQVIRYHHAARDTTKELFMRYRKMVAQPDTNEINRWLTASAYKNFTFFVQRYEPFPLICDGILADDLMFLRACERTRTASDAASVRNAFLPILYQLPHTDVARAIAEKLPDLQAGRNSLEETRKVFLDLQTQYVSLVKGNQEIDWRSLLQKPLTGNPR